MLKVIRSLDQLDIEQLQKLYAAPSYSDFYDAMVAFFEEPTAYICVWQNEGQYLSALRIEPYEDGYLVAGLETTTQYRRKGYAKALLKAVIEHLPENTKLYSHIKISNSPSIALHKVCGFVQILDHAKLLDGSVSTNYLTFIIKTPMR